MNTMIEESTGTPSMNAPQQLVEQLLDLSFEQRAFVRDILEESLEADLAKDEAHAAAWTAEIDRRIDAYERGESKATPWPEFRAELERMLASRRRSRTP
jgi:putative addiction module component (TIGR02574 family)